MTEQFPESHDEPLYELANTEQRAETYIRNVLLQGGQLAHRTFETAEDAHKAGDAHAEACIRLARSIQGLERIDMIARGEGVQVTNVQRIPSSEAGVVSFATNPTEPLVPLSMFDERRFHYSGIVSGVSEVDKNVWKVGACIVGTESTKKTWSLNPTQFGFPLSQLGLESMIIIPTSRDDVHIEISSLEQQRQRDEALKELAEQDVEQVGLANDVGRMHEVFSEKADHIIQFKEVALLRKIGQKGVQFGALGGKQADALNTALIKTIQANRPLIVSGRLLRASEDDTLVEQVTSGFNGTVIDVISQLPATEKKIGPTLVMMPTDDKSIHYVPLKNIISLKF